MAKRTRPRAARALRALPKAMSVGLVLNGLRLRQRATGLAHLDHGAAADAVDPDELDRWVVVTASGVEVDDDTRRAAVAHALTECLDVVDLVPSDLPVEAALELLRLVDVRTYRTSPLAPGRGAGHALVLSPEVAERARLAKTAELDPFEMAEVTAELKQFAPESTDLAVAPHLAAVPDDPATWKARLRGIWGGAGPIAQAAPVLTWGGLAAGVAADRAWGATAVAAYAAQPVVAFAGHPGGLAPRDLATAGAARPVREPRRWLRAVRSSWRSPVERDLSTELRPVYDELLADGTERFFERRRETCPWCGGTDLAVRISTGDRFQHKPGTFVLEECAGCGLVFQNPRLSLEGLDFYYRDFYDGLGGGQLASVFGASATPYTGRADMVRSFGQPKRWLDVGTGHGHFCLLARQAWPDTTFDGLDMSESVEIAERRGWIETGHRGTFPELAGELVGTYDVVSMHHYLEHTREPVDELVAAEQVLVPGGLLLIEVPDPACPWGRALGRAWLPWFQPQHQQLIPIERLEERLEELGFEVLDDERGDAHQAVELLAAAFFAVDSLIPDPRLPWGPGFDRRRWLARIALFTAAVPLLLVAGIADRLTAPFLVRTGRANAYRVLARKPA